MSILLLGAGKQQAFDRWIRADLNLVEQLKTSVVPLQSQPSCLLDYWSYTAISAVALIFSYVLSRMIPATPGFSNQTWMILLVTLFALFASNVALLKRVALGWSGKAYFLLFLVLASVGAKGNLKEFTSAPLFIGLGFFVVLIHAVFLLVAARWLRTPLGLVAVASQANIGGPVSAPIVGAAYSPSLASVGVLLGIFGNVIGTFAGLLCAILCRWVVGG